MKANELRIGNLVNINGIELTLKPNLFCLIIDEQIVLPKPIPLTEEWLLKFDEIKKFRNGIYLPIMNLRAEIHFEIYGNEIISTIKSDFANLILDRIKYVHQLQNLFFALTNTEINPKN